MIDRWRMVVRRLAARLRIMRDALVLARSPLFDAAWYREQMPGQRIHVPTLHYLRRGATEGLHPGPCFDGPAYLAAHADVDFSGGNPLLHYLARGQREGRAIFPAGISPRRRLAVLASGGSIDPLGPGGPLTPSEPYLASIIIPTRDRPTDLARCIHGVLHRTAHHNIEVLIVDNGSRTRRARILLQRLARDPRIRVLSHPDPFNWSAMNNHAAGLARGDFLVLLNNDITITAPHWLGEMLALAERPGIGAVGAKLLYPNGRIQHAGISLGRRARASHIFRRARADDPGPFGMLTTRRSVAAVTGACLAIRRASFMAVGGLEQVHLPITNSDVDLCLRLRARGLAIMWTPHAVLTHAEAVTRGLDVSPAHCARVASERKYLLATWGPLAEADPTLPPGTVIAGERLLRVLDLPRPAPQLAPATRHMARDDRDLRPNHL